MKAKLKEQAYDYVLDQLDDESRADFLVELKRDPDLRHYVFEIQDSLEESIYQPMQEPPSHVVWDSISRSIAEGGLPDQQANEVKVPPVSHSDSTASSRSRWIPYAGWAVAAVLFLVLGVSVIIKMIPAKQNTPQFIVFNLSDQQFDRQMTNLPSVPKMADDRFFALADEAQKLWDNMENSNGKVIQKAFTIIDPVQKMGFVGLKNIPELNPGEILFLWIYDSTASHYRPVGEIPGSSVEQAFYSFSLPESMQVEANFSQNYHVIITREQAEHISEAPQGKAVFGHKTLDI